MKHFFIITAISSVLVFAMASCTNYTVEEGKTNLEKESLQSLLLEKGTTPITANEAINVALLFNNQNKIETKGEVEKKVSDVYTVFREEGEPSMYAVNFQDDKGFVVVSASRKYYPILAMVEKGHFDDSFVYCPLGGWIDEQNEQIAIAERDEVDEETAKSIRIMWSAFEKKDVAKWIETKSEAEAFALRQSSVAAWEAQGYTCYALSEQPSEMSNSVYSNWCQIAQGLANPDYNYLTYSVILERRVDDSLRVGPLIKTTWERENGFNAALVDTAGHLVPVGSRPLAVGQVMRYFQKPTSYNWTVDFPLNYATGSIATFLKILSNRMGLTYYFGEEDATDLEALAVMIEYYSYSGTCAPFVRSSVVSNIQNGKPVILSGTRTYGGTTSSYAWVCEGNMVTAIHYEYELKVISVSEMAYEHAASESENQFGFVNYLYHNLGLGGSLNGWYISNSPSSGGNSMSTTNMIYNITTLE